MQFTSVLRTGLLTALALAYITGLRAQKPGEEAPARAEQGLPPRATPADYQAQAQAGGVTIAGEYMQHSVPTPDGIFTTDDYIMVETGLFAPAGKRLVLTPGDFSLRINGKKQTLPSVPFGYVLKSLKNPDWEMEQASVKAEKSKLNLGGGADQSDGTKPPPPKMPIDVQRAMEQKVQKASFPEGDRPLPQAGLLYFEYHGSLKGIRSIELMYAGPAGKATLALQP